MCLLVGIYIQNMHIHQSNVTVKTKKKKREQSKLLELAVNTVHRLWYISGTPIQKVYGAPHQNDVKIYFR